MQKGRFLMALFLASLAALSLHDQKNKFPSNINDGFVVEFSGPFDRIVIQTDEKNMPSRDLAEILLSPQTKIKNHKGKTAAADAILRGMEVEIEIDKNNPNQLIAKEIRLKTNPEKRVKAAAEIPGASRPIIICFLFTGTNGGTFTA
ncbi:MAG: hypothetical protein IPN69_23660 [Acidobacteria bacterium]|nr:hypothetical protein [Acidobacteriota bacterium]